MKHVFLVVDDFYPDAERLRLRALRLPYVRPRGVNYPGVVASTPDDIRPILERFSDLLGGIDIKATRDQGEFRITTASDMAVRTSMVHIDTPDFSAFVHLSKSSFEGTHFYRHKALGLDRVSAEDNRRVEVRQAIEADTLDLGAWEHTFTIPMKFNRLVIIDGKYFHSGPQRLIGATLAEGRLTQHFFFYGA
jgi:Family of unknown function (DUF6445)